MPLSERVSGVLARARLSGAQRERLVEVLQLLQQLHADEDMQVAAQLVGGPGREGPPLEEIEAQYGATVARLVANVRRLDRLDICPADADRPPEQAERLRRLLLAVVDDIRAVLIKLARRLVRLRHLKGEPYAQRRCVARESLEIFAPLANRLGIAQLKWEMEDLAFRYLDPLSYKKIAKGLEERRVDRERYVAEFAERLRELLDGAGIAAEITGRPKHIYSIWRKMQRKQVGLQELFDIRALRVIVDDVRDCYATLGLVHTHWHPIPSEFDDYIANPKPNGYQSLHTVVVGPGNKPIEIQIRTRAMHEFAELGFAAHWRYKEGEAADDEAMQAVVRSVRALLEENESDQQLVDGLKAEVFPEQVFVFTPRGDVVELPRGATPLDFAYAIHTELGHRCRGAKVDGRIVPLTRPLQNGERVEILVGSQPSPSRDWMNPAAGYLVSASARAKVRHWFHQQDWRKNAEAGRKILEQTARRLGVRPVLDEALLARARQPDENSFLISLGRGDIRESQLEAWLAPEPEEPATPETTIIRRVPGPREGQGARRAEVAGQRNFMVRVARCCKPVPGDDVIGYITQGQGVTVHRRDCPNIRHLPEAKQARLIDISWGEPGDLHPIEIEVLALDRRGLLNDITQVLVEEKANLLRADTRTDTRTSGVRMRLEVQVRHADQLAILLNKIRQVRNVLAADRRGG